MEYIGTPSEIFTATNKKIEVIPQCFIRIACINSLVYLFIVMNTLNTELISVVTFVRGGFVDIHVSTCDVKHSSNFYLREQSELRYLEGLGPRLKGSSHKAILSLKALVHALTRQPGLDRLRVRQRFVWLPWCLSMVVYTQLFRQHVTVQFNARTNVSFFETWLQQSNCRIHGLNYVYHRCRFQSQTPTKTQRRHCGLFTQPYFHSPSTWFR